MVAKCEFHIMHPNPTVSLPLHICPCNLHKRKQQTNLTIEAVVWQCAPTVHPFAQTALLANVHCSESLVWFEASGF